MAGNGDDNMVGREETQAVTLTADPRFSLFNFCHPLGEDYQPLVEFSLSDLVLPMQDGPRSSDERLQQAIVRKLFVQTFREATDGVSLISTSRVSIRSIEEIFSMYFRDLRRAVAESDNHPYGLLEELERRLCVALRTVCKPAPAEIKRHIAAHKPDDRYDDLLGWLWFDGRDEYSATLDDTEGSGSFCICVEDTDLDRLIGHARRIRKNLDQIDREVREFAAARLLGTHNAVWLQEGESPKSAQDFMHRMSLSTVSVSSEPGFELWYDDGNLFLGHSILVKANRIGDYRSASVEG